MSVLRMLSPARAASPHPSSSRHTPRPPTLTLHVPAYGALFMNPPEDLSSMPTRDEDQPRADQLLNGELEIHMPAGSGRRRCKSIRVGMRSTVRLDLGPMRMNEEDVIFERKVEIAGSSDGLWLDEGTQRFEFTLILPGNLAPHDWHVNGRISHDLYAEVEGVADPQAPSSSGGLFSFRSRPHQSRTRSGEKTPRSRSRAGSPRTGSPITSNQNSYTNLNSLGHTTPTGSSSTTSAATLTAAAAALSINGKDTLPQTPSYEESEAEASEKVGDDSWLKGFFEVKRALMLFYNPNPAGGTTELADRQTGFAQSLGAFELEMMSDVLSICALLQAKFELASLSPLSTIFSFRILLSQTHSLISPRDDPITTKPWSSTRYFTIIEKGKKPPANHQYPDKHYPAIWRGVEAGGKDSEGLKIEAKGRLPDDDSARPSTLPYVTTPIRVSHSLIAEVYFSIWGEDDAGQAMKHPGPGGLRLMKINRPLVLPSCAIIPQTLDLPSYEDHAEFQTPNTPGSVCPRHGCPLIPSSSTPEWTDFNSKKSKGFGPGVTPPPMAPRPTSSSNPLYNAAPPVSSISKAWTDRGYTAVPQYKDKESIQRHEAWEQDCPLQRSSTYRPDRKSSSPSGGATPTDEMVCPLCFFYQDMPAGPFGRGTCACGVGIEQMEERMRRFAEVERDRRGSENGLIVAGGEEKVRAERERGRERGRQL